MKALVGDQRCETGIESVDAQHRRLVETINQLGDSRTTILLAALDLRRAGHPAKNSYCKTNDTADSFAHDIRVLKGMCKAPV